MRLATIDDFIRRTFASDSAPHVNTVRRHIREGKLPGRRLGARYYVDEAALDSRFDDLIEKVKSDVRRPS